jgi:hypothetical protein
MKVHLKSKAEAKALAAAKLASTTIGADAVLGSMQQWSRCNARAIAAFAAT